jgi:hypothetical protein
MGRSYVRTDGLTEKVVQELASIQNLIILNIDSFIILLSISVITISVNECISIPVYYLTLK